MSFADELEKAHKHFLESKESKLGIIKEKLKKELLEAVYVGRMCIDVDYKQISPHLHELQKWAQSEGCDLRIYSPPQWEGGETTATMYYNPQINWRSHDSIR